MRLTLAALLAVAYAAGVTPAAAACGPWLCPDEAVADDSYPPGHSALPPNIQAQVAARDDRGLSLAGFYNDPAVAIAQPAPPAYGAFGPAPVAVGAPAPGYGYGYGYGYAGPHRHGPYVVTSPYGRRRVAHAHNSGHRVY